MNEFKEKDKVFEAVETRPLRIIKGQQGKASSSGKGRRIKARGKRRPGKDKGMDKNKRGPRNGRRQGTSKNKLFQMVTKRELIINRLCVKIKQLFLVKKIC